MPFLNSLLSVIFLLLSENAILHVISLECIPMKRKNLLVAWEKI